MINSSALLFGIIGSSQLHLARCLQQEGICSFRNLLSLFRFNRTGVRSSLEVKKNKLLVYLTGLILSNTCFIWIMLANRSGSPGHFTSMYSTGLLITMLYAHLFRKEKFSLNNIIGLILIIGGSVLLGWQSFAFSAVNIFRTTRLILFPVGSILLLCLGMIVLNLRRNAFKSSALNLGLSAGSLAACDPILKYIGQGWNETVTMWPQTAAGWLIFLYSILFTTLSFLILQRAFLENIRIHLLIPAFNAGYIGMPWLVWKILDSKFQFNAILFIALLMILTGLHLLRYCSNLRPVTIQR